MILCVTLNPCLDKTLTVPAWQPGDSVRGISTRALVGGKGNNVARAIKRFGHVARPVTFLGGAVGRECEERLRRDDGLDPIVVNTAAPTRVILTVRNQLDNAQTAFFDPDPEITPDEASRFVGTIAEALRDGGVQALTLSGSSPSTATHGVFHSLIGLARRHGVITFLDTYGPALAAIRDNPPDVLQCNRREVSVLTGGEAVDDAAAWQWVDAWAARGVQCVIVTDGEQPTFARADGETFVVSPPHVALINPVGSGDSFLAGLVDAWLSRQSPEDMLRRATASGASNAMVWDAGAIDVLTIDRLMPLVGIRRR